MNPKKIITWICAACLCLQPLSALAQTDVQTNTNNENPISSEATMAKESVTDYKEIDENDNNNLSILGALNYTIEIEGQVITDTNKADVLGDGTVSFDDTTNTLLLNSADIAVSSGNYGVRILNEGEATVTIVLNGSNKIHCDKFYGIYATGSVTFKGNGTLDCYGSDYGMLIKGDVTIEEDVDITSKCGDIISGDSYGLRGNGAFVIKGNAQVTAEAGYAPNRSNGLYAYTTLEISENAIVNATGGTADNDSYGIRTTNMTINGGTISAIGGDAQYGGSGIYTQTLEINGGITTLQGGKMAQGPSYGLMAAKELTVSGGQLNCYGGNGLDASYGLYAGDSVRVTGGQIDCESGDGEYTYGIETGNLEITGGNVKATAQDADSYSWGIQCTNICNISGGTVEAKGGNAVDFSYGIQTSSSINITDANVTIQNGTSKNSHGMWAFEKITTKDSNVNVTSMDNAISTPYGMTEIICDEIQISWLPPDSKAINVVISNVGYSNKLKAHTVYVHEPSIKKSFLVIDGKSVNEMYRDHFQVDDIAKIMTVNNDGYLFDGFYSSESFAKGTEYSFDDAITSSISVYHKWLRICNVTTEISAGGTIEISNNNPAEGSKVTITVNPQDNYVIDALVAIDAEDNEITLTKESDNVYSYIQPANDVHIKATFKAVPPSSEDEESNTSDDDKIDDKIDDNPVSPDEISPKTGDDTELLILTISLILSATAVLFILLNKRRAE